MNIKDILAKVVCHPLGHWHIEGERDGILMRLEKCGEWQPLSENAFASQEEAEAALGKFTDICVDGWRCEFGYFIPFKNNWHISHVAYYMYFLTKSGTWENLNMDEDAAFFATEQEARAFAIECSKRESPNA